LKNRIEVPVVIVGAGVVGLNASIMLSGYNVRSLLVEKNPTTTPYPKARVINPRTMEIYRQLGIEERIRRVAIPPKDSEYVVWMRTLADGKEISKRRMTTYAHDDSIKAISPTFGCTTCQIDVERILSETAIERGASCSSEVLYNMELVALSQDDSGVSSKILNLASGEEFSVRSDYVIATDGARSTVRKILGIGSVGERGLTQWVNIIFRADLGRWLEGKGINICFFLNHDAPGSLMPVAQRPNVWTLGAVVQTNLKDYESPEFSKNKVLAVVGVPDLPVEILKISPWSVSARYAKSFSNGRVFLAGDSAHENPPAGGFGMNTGIQDAYNLTWKLAFVVENRAGPELLQTYEAERKPVARVTVSQALLNIASHQPTKPDAVKRTLNNLATEELTQAASAHNDDRNSSSLLTSPGATSARSEQYGELGLVFGINYELSNAVVPDGSNPLKLSDPVTKYEPNARPGARMPHMWVIQDGKEISTLDLVGSWFLLLACQNGRTWCRAAKEVSELRSIPIHAHTVGQTGQIIDPNGRFPEAFGLNLDGAVLVRPDGHVALRSQSLVSDPRDLLCKALSKILARN
jgi:putative polyketide hydroxylase